jgi:hypothetical protein
MTRSGWARQAFFKGAFLTGPFFYGAIFYGAMPHRLMRCGKAREGRHYAPQLSVDERGQIAIKLGRLVVAKTAASRPDKINELGRRTSCGLTETHP